MENISGFLFILPSIVFFVVFAFYPFIYSFRLSLFQWEGGNMRNLSWSGLYQYSKALSSHEFWNSLKVTALFTFPTVFLHISIGLLLAVLLNRSIPCKTLLRGVFFVPVIMSTIVVAIIWKFMLSPTVGLFNYFLNVFFGLPKEIPWLQDPKLALPGLIIVHVWKWIGYFMVIYLAALQDIPVSIYESAELDGASSWQQFRHITLPLLSNTTWFLIIISIINTFQVFDIVYAMTSGGPVGSTDVVVYYIYRNAFLFYDMPYASAVAWLLFSLIFILTAMQLKFSRAEWSY